MRFLADVGISPHVVEALRERGHDVLHAAQRSLLRASDASLMELARRDGRIVLTHDLDFGDLLAASGAALPSVITFRLRDQRPQSINPLLHQVLTQQESALADGCIVLVEESRYRVRPLPIRRPA